MRGEGRWGRGVGGVEGCGRSAGGMSLQLAKRPGKGFQGGIGGKWLELFLTYLNMHRYSAHN